MSRLFLPALAAVLFAAAAAPAVAEESCDASGKLMSREAVAQSLRDHGYTKIRSLSEHNGCYEAKGFDSKGNRFELEVNGATGAIVTAE